jgi:hypothetical protein
MQFKKIEQSVTTPFKTEEQGEDHVIVDKEMPLERAGFGSLNKYCF